MINRYEIRRDNVGVAWGSNLFVMYDILYVMRRLSRDYRTAELFDRETKEAIA